jgi:hypothetical protein
MAPWECAGEAHDEVHRTPRNKKKSNLALRFKRPVGLHQLLHEVPALLHKFLKLLLLLIHRNTEREKEEKMEEKKKYVSRFPRGC